MISSICQRIAHEEKFLKMKMERAHDFPLCFVSSPQFLQHGMSQMCPTQSLWSPDLHEFSKHKTTQEEDTNTALFTHHRTHCIVHIHTI